MTLKNASTRRAALASRHRLQQRHDRLAGPRIRQLLAQGEPLRAICRQLEAEQIPTPRGGLRWHPEMVKRVSARWLSSRRGSLPVRETNLQLELGGVL